MQFSFDSLEFDYVYVKAQNKAQNKAQRTGGLSDREFILSLLGNNPFITQAELAEEIGKSRRSVQTLMKQLTEEGVIERIGSKKFGMWAVK